METDTDVTDPSVLPDKWTMIAVRLRESPTGAYLSWVAVPGAPIGIMDAHKLVAQGRLLMAQRHAFNRVELVIRPPRHPPRPDITAE